MFSIKAENLHWIDDIDNGEDLCLHGHAIAIIGSEVLEYENTTVSAKYFINLPAIRQFLFDIFTFSPSVSSALPLSRADASLRYFLRDRNNRGALRIRGTAFHKPHSIRDSDDTQQRTPIPYFPYIP